MNRPAVLLRRSGRTVVASADPPGPLPDALAGRLADELTYFEKTYDFAAAAEGHSGFDLVERRLYQPAEGGRLVFPLGLRPRVAARLKEWGCGLRYLSPPVPPELAKAWEPDWAELVRQFDLYPGQDECLCRLLAAEGGVVSAATGWGKSKLFQMICVLLPHAKIHVVTKAVTLAEQIRDDLARVVPRVGMIGGGRRERARVTVLVAASLMHGDGDSDILLADEVHQLAAPTYARGLAAYSRAKMIGFSATPTGRADGRDVEAEALFGPVLYEVPYQQAQAEGRVVPIAVEWLKVDRGPDASGIQQPTARERVSVWCNDHRNALIAERCRRFAPDEQVLVMVKTIEHAARLKALLPDYELCYSANGMDERRLARLKRAGLVPETETVMTPQRLRELRAGFAAGTVKKVIANYIWSAGVNFLTLSALVRADAGASAIQDGQIPGRICRRVAGVKESAVLVDCWDLFDNRLLSRARSRRRNYQARGWAQSDGPAPGGAS